MTRGLGGHSPANIAQHLSGMDFPAGRQELLQRAKENGAEEDIVEILRHIPEQGYQIYGRCHGWSRTD